VCPNGSGISALESVSDESPDRLRSGHGGIVRGDPQIEQLQIVGLKANSDGQTFAGRNGPASSFCAATN
jgi:hypothetical protein